MLSTLHRRLFRLAIALSASLAGSIPVAAQVVPGPPPTSRQCTAGEAALLKDPKASINETIVDQCGSAGGAAISTVIARSHGEVDPDFLSQLAVIGGSIRDTAVFFEALALAKDARATSQARGASLLVLMRQYSLNLIFDQPTASLLGGTTPVSCRFLSGEGMTHFSSARTLPPDFAVQGQKAVSSIAADASAPARVRAIARCVAGFLPKPPVDVSWIRLTSVCATRFTIHNPTTSSFRVHVRCRRCRGNRRDRGPTDVGCDTRHGCRRDRAPVLPRQGHSNHREQ